MLVSLLFVMATVVEFAIVLCIKKLTDTNENQVTARRPLFDGKTRSLKDRIPDSNQVCYNDKALNRNQKDYSTTDRIDLAALLFFMFLYSIFNAAYFFHYI